jgi:phage terminase large subunit GpA-like protein
MPARYLFLDEVDGYPGDVEGEGDPILLAERRSATFQRRKILLVSTPKTKGLSRIDREYEASDQRRFFVPCPHCHEPQVLDLANLRWPEGRPREAEYACAHCGALIGERHKTWMLEHGAWRPTAPGDGRTAGFHLSSGWFSWADAAEMYEQASKTPDLMKGFVNTVLGLPFEEEAEAPEWQRLYERRETWRIGIVPEQGLFLTAGVDVQKDRLEAEVVAWGRDKESWSVDYQVIEGDTARPEVWAKLSSSASWGEGAFAADRVGTAVPQELGSRRSAGTVLRRVRRRLEYATVAHLSARACKVLIRAGCLHPCCA